MIALPPKFVAFDLDTTGLVNRKDEIIEIGAVKFTVEVKNGRVVPKLISEFDTLVKPNMLIPAEATNVNHITDKMVENAPPVGEALKQFTAFCGIEYLRNEDGQYVLDENGDRIPQSRGGMGVADEGGGMFSFEYYGLSQEQADRFLALVDSASYMPGMKIGRAHV